ncbi:hypothetical protein [Nocardioides ultimimeridianus]
MSTQKPKRPASSRTSTSRPRKIAGRVESDPADSATVEAPAPQRSVRPAEATAPSNASAPRAPGAPTAPAKQAKPSKPAAPPRPLTDRLGLFAGRPLTRVLMIALAVLALVVVAQGIWFGVKGDDHHGSAQQAQGTIDVPADTPVQMNQSDIDQGVDQAAKDVVTLMSLHYKTFDEDVAKAVDLTTSRFAPEYQRTTADLKDDYVKKQVELSAKVIGEGVVKANTTRLQALLFVNQWATRGVGKDRRLVLTSFRVLMTMVHTNTGWLVDGMDTQ